MDTNQTSHDVGPSPGLVHYIYTFGGSCPLTEFGQVQYWLSVQIVRSPIYWYSVTARHSSSGRQPNCGVQHRAPPILFGRARPSRWASAHVVVRNLLPSLTVVEFWKSVCIQRSRGL